jgi:hypothetical protein
LGVPYIEWLFLIKENAARKFNSMAGIGDSHWGIGSRKEIGIQAEDFGNLTQIVKNNKHKKKIVFRLQSTETRDREPQRNRLSTISRLIQIAI